MNTLTIVAVHATGEDVIRACEIVGETIGRMIAQAKVNGHVAEPVRIEGPAETEPDPPRKLRRKRRVAAVKSNGEPDGFSLPTPPPATPIHASNPPKARRQFSKTPKPGALGARIVELLDNYGGVASYEVVAQKLGASAHGVKLTGGKCRQLKNLPGGRIALAGYEDDD